MPEEVLQGLQVDAGLVGERRGAVMSGRGPISAAVLLVSQVRRLIRGDAPLRSKIAAAFLLAFDGL
ncbi:hypothetical protein [Micromonospora humida]|uniref:Uncharacterized protein n=1 Tax=Micromonospora humida TaxID=2809018 RepID=A0ABS2ISV1_9ACTN|nr:hypothetical protein [Micromonospora humida]MBM7077423.1 hypothetical protein [Micromonospora humida]